MKPTFEQTIEQAEQKVSVKPTSTYITEGRELHAHIKYMYDEVDNTVTIIKDTVYYVKQFNTWEDCIQYTREIGKLLSGKT